MIHPSPCDRPLPRLLFLPGIVFLAIFVFYWLTTLLYVLPNNPLRIQLDSELNAFEKWGFQRWNFFAPPPTRDTRLYFAFSPRNGKGVTIEVLEEIYKRKQQQHPFNFNVEVIDYVVSGVATSITDSMREIFRYRKVVDLYGGDPEYLTDLALRSLQPATDSGFSIRVLLRYAGMVADQQAIPRNGLTCQIAFTHVPIRPFSQRYNDEYEVDELLVYRTGLLAVPQRQIQ